MNLHRSGTTPGPQEKMLMLRNEGLQGLAPDRLPCRGRAILPVHCGRLGVVSPENSIMPPSHPQTATVKHYRTIGHLLTISP